MDGYKYICGVLNYKFSKVIQFLVFKKYMTTKWSLWKKFVFSVLFCLEVDKWFLEKESHFHQIDLIVYTSSLLKWLKKRYISYFDLGSQETLERKLNFTSLGNLYF